MKHVDQVFKENLQAIMAQDWEVDNRAKWKDGSPVMTKRIFGVTNTYDLEKEFPLMTLRPTEWKKAINEILWIYQKRSTDIRELNSKIWVDWSVGDHIFNCYGAQIDKPSYGYDNQMDYILGELTKNPTSRRLIMCMWDTEHNSEKSLLECAFMTQWNVQNGRLNMILFQRSQDFLVANAWNVCQYAALLSIVAMHCGLIPGKMYHWIGDCHMYNKHEEQAKELLDRDSSPIELRYQPLFCKSNFYQISENDFYEFGERKNKQLKFEVAV